jgi:signal peptidase I
MAPTLQGRHMDVTCPQCGYNFRVSASSENDDSDEQGQVVSGICPICRHTMFFDRSDPNQRSFTGDRILVSKFSYELYEPQRWDVIVFKYPGNAKQNYIKRLVGLPNETVRIEHGDIYTHAPGESEFRIARKPPEKLKAMLQLVDDTDHWAQALVAAGWPSRWQHQATSQGAPHVWQSTMTPHDGPSAAQSFAVEGAAGEDTWLRYHHIVPTGADWEMILNQQTPPGLNQRRGTLIRDFYAYNTGEVGGYGYPGSSWRDPQESGLHWVGDIALEGNVVVKSDQGEVLLEIVEAGVHYTCRINVESGVARLLIDGGHGEFSHDDGSGAVQEVKSKLPTTLRGPGKYELRFSNADNQLMLWVDDEAVEFDGPTTFPTRGDSQPHWTSGDPLDLAPAGIGVRGASVEAHSLRIYRDVYYIALEKGGDRNYDYDLYLSDEQIQSILDEPERWGTTELFAQRRNVTFEIGADEFFPLGDNSPQSKDARIWETDPHVDRELLTGKALFIYWPHHWRRPIPFTPNIARMRLIR